MLLKTFYKGVYLSVRLSSSAAISAAAATIRLSSSEEFVTSCGIRINLKWQHGIRVNT